MKEILLVLAGAVIGALPGIINSYYENKKSYRELLVTTAVKNWEVAKEFTFRTNGRLTPLDAFLFHQSEIMKLLDDGEVTEEKLKKALDRTENITDFFRKHTDHVKARVHDTV